MYIRVLALLALAFVFCVVPISAQSCPEEEVGQCFIFPVSSTPTSHTFDFGTDGNITFTFETVLVSFALDVTAVDGSNPSVMGPDFPDGTVCIPYDGTGGSGRCVRYNVTGVPFPVKGVNFRGLITVLLNYDSSSITDGVPVFGHAPGDTPDAVFSEDILTFYVDPNAPAFTTPPCIDCRLLLDPGMGGKIPGISSFEAFKKPFANGGSGAVVCSPGVTAVSQNSTSGNNPIVEVSFKLATTAANCASGHFLRDKTATLSVGIADGFGNVTPQPLVNGGDSNKFHFNNQNGTNVQDINTNGLQSGTYQVSVISTVFAPVNTTFVIP